MSNTLALDRLISGKASFKYFLLSRNPWESKGYTMPRALKTKCLFVNEVTNTSKSF